MSLENLSPEEVAKLKQLLNSDESSSEKTPAEKKPKPKKESAPKKPAKKKGPNKVVILAVSIVGVIALALGYGLVVDPAIRLQQAKDELSQEVASSAVVAGNSEMIAYSPLEEDLLPGSNPKQLALGSDGMVSEPPYFEFRSENSTKDSKVVDLYIDFYSQRSRDFIAFNQATLSNLIGNGTLILRVHPVLQNDGFSLFAPEALAESFVTSPKLSWAFFTKLMKESNQVLSVTSTEDDTPANEQEIVEFIAKIAVEVGIPTGAGTAAGETGGVDANSMKYLSFFSWLHSGTRAEELAVGYYPPILYIDGEEVDQEKWPLGDSDKVLDLLTQKRTDQYL